MTPERYLRLGQLFNKALELSPEERQDFLTRSCQDDAELRAEVEKLLANHIEADDFLSRPALDVAARLLAPDPGSVAAGRQIGRYEIVSLLGAGGMGQVFLAKDTRLGRKAALKLLPARFFANTVYLRRLEREALAASALNHPNILTIYEFGADGGTHFLAAEYVQGETLRQRMVHGRLAISEILDITVQIASALHAAHQAGIIHRDIKPENVMVRRDGIVKVLDFGLAKLDSPAGQDDGMTVNEEHSSLTQQGAILGTAAYMSPEQARGEKVDARSDLFSLGVVLYELLAGRRPFKGATASHMIVAILEKEPPPLAEAGRTVPAELERILNQMLAKSLDERYADAAGLLSDLKGFAKRLEREAESSFSSPGARDTMDQEHSTQIIQPHTNEQRVDATRPGARDDPLHSAVELAHVLFCDIVGYSLMPIDRQTHAMQTLQGIVRHTDDYKRAEAKGRLVRLPAGDGMALVFLQDVTAPVRCACDIVRALRSQAEIKLRIGVHSGPVYQSADINANRNVVGGGVNLAQRVMDSGDAGHILVSRNVAEVLEQVSHWRPMLHDLGEHLVKHDVPLRLFNLYDHEVGNPAIPEKLRQERAANETRSTAPPIATAAPATDAPKDLKRRKALWAVCGLLALGLASIPAWNALRPNPGNSPSQSAAGLPTRALNYYLTVQKYRNGKPYQTEFQSSGREIFEPGWQFKLTVSSPEAGYLYLLNEEPADKADKESDYVLLFPLSSHNNGSARLAAGENFQTGAYVFDDKPGTEQFRLIWTAQPAPELEALRALVNPTDQGRVTDPAQIQALHRFLQEHSNTVLESVKDTKNQRTNLKGTGSVLVALVELEHH